MVKFSGIEILQIGFVVHWTNNMDENLPFSFALSIFSSCVCFGICADAEEVYLQLVERFAYKYRQLHSWHRCFP